MSERSVETDNQQNLAVPVDPPAYSRDAGSLAGCLIVSIFVFLPVLLYFGLFGAILLDELVLESNLFLSHLPDPAIEFLRVIYAPLIWLADQFDG